jgi:hypothetical protein
LGAAGESVRAAERLAGKAVAITAIRAASQGSFYLPEQSPLALGEIELAFDVIETSLAA